MEDYRLAPDKYTLGNALVWGNCNEHRKKIFEAGQSWSGRIVHSLIAFLEAIPVLGQIASLAEMRLARGGSASKAIKNPSKLSVQGEQGRKGPLSGAAEKVEIIYMVPADAKKGKEALELVKKLIQDGMTIDRDYIMFNYPNLIARVGKENEAEARKLINETYLSQLQEGISAGEVPIPQSVLALLKYHNKESVVQSHEAIIRQEMTTMLANLPKDKLQEPEPSQLVDQLRSILFECISKNIEMDQDEVAQFKEDLIHLHDLELHWLKVKEESQKHLRERISECDIVISDLCKGINDQKFVADLKQTVKDELLRVPIPDFTQSQINAALRVKSKDNTFRLLRAIAVSINQDDVDNYKNYISQSTEHVLKQILSSNFVSSLWMKKFNCEQKVRYSQISGGNDEVLGKGCCLAINLNWGKSLATLGTTKIKSVEQLYQNPDSEGEQSKLLIKALTNTNILEKAKKYRPSKHDSSEDEDSSWDEFESPRPDFIYDDSKDNVKTKERFVQAKFAHEFKSDNSTHLIQNVVKKDGFAAKKVPINKLQTIGTNLKTINSDNKKNGNDFDSLGFIALTIRDNTGVGHAIGCKIDHNTDLFRFWDPNFGIFETKNFEDFCNAFDAFLEQHYKGWFPTEANEIFKVAA